ncbi:methionine synthase II [Klebsiella pneumoniae]|uniref:Methionine synthase II n=1 Tax=Klebsiella pneumoniae TaxID=573 RepID=A0A377ZTN4_KLEPN|nr:methionine synthase II [Klebsiella pneumoniae]
MQRQQAPFRADIVGSFLRPDSIKQARQQLAEGIIDAAQLREIENNAIPSSGSAAMRLRPACGHRR